MMKTPSYIYSFLGLLLAIVLASCSQSAKPLPENDVSEYEIAPDGLSLNTVNTPRMIVRLAIYKDSLTNQRSGKVVLAWGDQAGGSHLTGTVSVKLRQVGSTTTLAEVNNASVDSVYLAPTIVQTSGISLTGPLCVEVTAWDLSAGSYTFNDQVLPLVFCNNNVSETGSDLKVSLDANSQTSVLLDETFPFIIATQNLGKQKASDVVVTLTLPTALEFVSDNSLAYNCTATTATEISCARNGSMPVARWGLPINLKGKTITAGADINVSISTTSTDPVSTNNSFTQAIVVNNKCGADLMPDDNLRAEVKTALSITNDADLCVDDLQSSSFTRLDADESSITNLTGLEYAVNLTYLFPYNNQITDISALAGLTNLTYLYLNGNQITDISALDGLTNLTTLYLSNNQITDISALAGLTNLTTLYLHNNQINDIQALVDNTGLDSDDLVIISYNNLDLTSGSDDWNNITILEGRGVYVIY